MKRAEVWWADLPSPAGSRPVVLLTRDAIINSIGSIVVTLVTRTVRHLETEITLGKREGLPCPCVANLDNILTIPKQRLIRQLGALSREKIDALNHAARFALDLG